MIDEKYIMGIVEGIRSSKSGIHPDYALMGEISSRVMDDVRSCLNGMVRSGSLRWHRTVNDTAFEPAKALEGV